MMTYEIQIKCDSLHYFGLVQGFSNCGTCTTSGTPATVQWHTDLEKIKGCKIIVVFFDKCSYMENFTERFFFI
jgi:hypothetical protein